MPEKGYIAKLYKEDDTARQEILETVRLCASLTKPWICPPAGTHQAAKLPTSYQSIGSRGIMNLEGRMLMALFPPSQPWFRLQLSPDIKYNPEIPPETIQQWEQQLFLRELIIQATLDSAPLKPKHLRKATGFRSQKRTAISQVLITGDVLEQLTDDYRIKVYRRDQYVTRRDSCGTVLYHIIKENIDPLGLPPEILSAAGLSAADLAAKPVNERLIDIYTLVERQPQADTWVIRQELNDVVVNESEEKVSPFFSTPFELAPGDDYGRGFIEINLGDLRSLNALEERLLEFAATAAKHHPIIDYASNVRDKDFMKESGEIIHCRVQGGRAQDIGFLSVDRLNDFNVVYQSILHKTKNLATAMLIESEIQPRGERVTATAIQRVAMELEGALGGVYAPIADEQQIPLLQRVIYQLERDKVFPPLPDESVHIEALTGLAALGRQVDMNRLMTFAQVVSQLGPQAMARIDPAVLMAKMAQYLNLYEAGLVKSDEQMAAEAQQAMAAAAAAPVAQEAAKAVGKIAQQAISGG